MVDSGVLFLFRGCQAIIHELQIEQFSSTSGAEVGRRLILRQFRCLLVHYRNLNVFFCDCWDWNRQHGKHRKNKVNKVCIFRYSCRPGASYLSRCVLRLLMILSLNIFGVTKLILNTWIQPKTRPKKKQCYADLTMDSKRVLRIVSSETFKELRSSV